MDALVIDASIAVKWVVEEGGTKDALLLRKHFRFLAPELITAECSNILWKKVRRGDLTQDEAILAAQLLERSGIELLTMRGLMERATALSIDIGHPAYDCIYLALAERKQTRFVTADDHFLRIVNRHGAADLATLCVSLNEIAAEVGDPNTR
jgi:predicted nucleic acid-binding protein